MKPPPLQEGYTVDEASPLQQGYKVDEASPPAGRLRALRHRNRHRQRHVRLDLRRPRPRMLLRGSPPAPLLSLGMHAGQ